MSKIEEQVTVFMNGSEYGNDGIKTMMTQELKKRLIESRSEGRPLEVYCGYDVTAPDLHLGHTITMRKLRQFQEFGHNVTFLIGTFTTLIGDPSDREHERGMAIPESIRKNAETYAEQAFKILDRTKTSIRYNHEWLSSLSLSDIINMSSHFTVQQFINRDRLRKRLESNEPLWLRELLYPLAQGYDAVSLKSDIQIGATEQLFNLMIGRKLQQVFGQKPQVCITLPVLTGTDGKMRMSKSQGNYIGIDEAPEEHYGKVMSLPDELIIHYFNLITRWTPDRIQSLEQDINDGSEHTMEAKKKLAWEIVDSLYGKESADAAALHFTRVHQESRIPDEIPVFIIDNPVNVITLLVETGICNSKSEARRAIHESSVRIDRKEIKNVNHLVEKRNAVLQRGKRTFIQLTVKE